MTNPWEHVRTEVADAVAQQAATETQLATGQQQQIALGELRTPRPEGTPPELLI